MTQHINTKLVFPERYSFHGSQDWWWKAQDERGQRYNIAPIEHMTKQRAQKVWDDIRKRCAIFIRNSNVRHRKQR